MSSKKEYVGTILGRTICQKKWLSLGIAAAVCTAVIFSLFPPLILGKIVDSITAGKQTAFWMVLAYMGLIALTGLMESARESLLTVFGQKITHALRSSLIEKFTRLTADG